MGTAALTTAGAYGLVAAWWLVVTSFVVDPLLVYLDVADPSFDEDNAP